MLIKKLTNRETAEDILKRVVKILDDDAEVIKFN